MLTLSIGVLVFMFTFTYLPQVAVLSAVSGPFAVLAAGVLVIGESSVIAGVLGRVCLMEEGVVDTFDAVLVENGMMDLVAEGRQINAGSRDAIGKLGKLVKRPFVKFSPSSIISFGITTTLLEFVPLASIFFAFTNAAGAALWVVDIERGNGTAPALREQAKKAE
ncbi:hypothetical protein FGG08_002576 [Glutinoglossum americanum]|uniref:Uncharacterized protein n=1 Tax=Glutinoglossum americanum TaxID=1670608 RepID=A0A9P8I4D8_9PEZI|nr:hypothetical protein FGG08_002576 [Glutinoglossum americanum]